MTATTLLIDGVTLHGTDPGGNAMVIREIEGLLDGPGVRDQEIPRPTDHGDFDVPVTRGRRRINAKGFYRADSDAVILAFRDAFAGILGAGDAGTLEASEFGRTLTASVRLGGDPLFGRIGSSGMGEWTLKLRAANPRLYGATHSFSGGDLSAIEHAGNFPATPRCVVAGSSGGGYTVTGPGSRIVTVTEPLVSGHPHTLNFAKGGLYIDGSRVLGGFTAYQPWAVPKGTTVAASTSAGTLTVEVEDTYI